MGNSGNIHARNLYRAGSEKVVASVAWLEKLSAFELQTYLVMKVMQDRGQVMSYLTISKAVGRSKDSIRRHIDRMVDMGLIKRVAPPSFGRGHVHTYRILDGV